MGLICSVSNRDFQTKIGRFNNNLKTIYAIGTDCWELSTRNYMDANIRINLGFSCFCRTYLYQQEPSSYLCQLPCHLDCTCRLFWHFSGLLRSQVMGEKSKLSNSSQPSDIAQSSHRLVAT